MAVDRIEQGLGELMAIHFGDKETMLLRLEAILHTAGMQRVDRQHYEDFDNYTYPSAFINDIRETRRGFLHDVWRVNWTVAIVAFDYSEAAVLSTKLNVLLKTIKTAVNNDYTLNGQAYSIVIDDVSTDAAIAFPHCVGLFSVSIMYLEKDSG
jgi:hypothetical protein